MHPLRALGFLFVAAALILTGSIETEGTTDIGEAITLSATSYFYIEVVPGVGTNGSDMDVSWQSTSPIDVWLIRSPEFENYKRGQEFDFEIEQHGTSGAVRFNVSAEPVGDTPFYLVFDNTLQGPTAPPTSGSSSVAYVSITGETRMAGWHGGQSNLTPSDPLLGYLFAAIGLGVPVTLLFLFLVLRRRRRNRLAEVRRQMEADPGSQQAGLPASPVTAPARFCAECGKPLRAGVLFCTECGARV